MSNAQNPTDALPTGGSLQDALEFLVRHFRCDSGTIHAIAADGQLHLKALVGAFPPPVLDAIRTIPVGKGLAGLAAQRRAPVTVCNLQTDQSGDVRPGARATGMEGAITVPAIDPAGGAVVGVVGIACAAARTYTTAETEQLLALAASLSKRLTTAAATDPSARK